jgi:hypothetical protein
MWICYVHQSQMPPPGPMRTLTRSTESFKVLTECPLIVMLLFQVSDSHPSIHSRDTQ